jgi:hypothetical protein
VINKDFCTVVIINVITLRLKGMLDRKQFLFLYCIIQLSALKLLSIEGD